MVNKLQGNSISFIPDPKLPQLQKVLSESYMLDYFRNYFDGNTSNGTGKIIQCQIIERIYHPGKQCYITYKVSCSPGGGEQIWFAQVQGLHIAKKTQGQWQSINTMCFPELGMFLWCFPHDPRLTSLVELADPRRVPSVLPKLFNEKLNGIMDHNHIGIKPLKYVPTRGCTISIQFQNSLAKRHTKILAKIYGDTRGSKVYDVMKQLWCRQQLNPYKTFGVIEPLGYDEKRRVLWQGWCQGDNFVNFARKNGLDSTCSVIANGLASLHQSKLLGLPIYSQEENFKKLRERSSRLITFHKEFEAPLFRLVSGISDIKVLWRPTVMTPIHGDFNHSQILFWQDKAIFIDFDSASFGDPLYDVAHFISCLYRLVDEELFALQEVTRAAKHFLRTYERKVPWAVSDEALRGHLATVLISRRANKILRRMEGNALRKINDYMNLADGCLSGKLFQ